MYDVAEHRPCKKIEQEKMQAMRNAYSSNDRWDICQMRVLQRK